MGLIKKDVATLNGQPTLSMSAQVTKPESGTEAAITRLQAPKPKVAKASAPVYKQRDFDAEAKGKVRCVMFEAALQSPALAGLPFKSLEEFLEIVAKAADVGVNYTWR